MHESTIEGRLIKPYRQIPLPPGVTFSVLGPMSISNGVDTAVLPSSKPTILLAAMLLCPGEIVSIDFLARAAWGEDFPTSARSTLQTYILRLRQIFAKFGISHNAIRTVPGGYSIPVTEESLDLAAFRSLIRVAESDPDPQAELRYLRKARALWRGTPIANIQSELLHGYQVPRLTEEWLRASERYFRLLIGAGECREVLAELRPMAYAHPGHEPLWELLIEALYRAGRQTEALAECRAVTQYLRDEHGVDRGPALQQLEMSVLRGEELSGTPPIGASARAGPLAIASRSGDDSLPRDLADFTGRADVLASLRSHLTGNQPAPEVAVISGPPGIGKTALSIRAAHLLAADFPGGCSFVQVTGPDGRVLAAQAPAGLEAADASPARSLAILDGVVSLEQVLPFLPATTQSALIITSRTSLASLATSTGASIYRLGPLAPTESLALLESILGVERVSADRAAAAALADLCGHFPIALRIAATRFLLSPRHRLVRAVNWLREDLPRRLAVPGDPDGSVAALFDGYFAELDDQAATALRAIGKYGARPLSLSECADLLGMPAAEAEPVLDRLIDAGLLEHETVDQYRMAALICTFAAGPPEPLEEAGPHLTATGDGSKES